MLDISQIFQNTSGDLNDDDIQRMIDSIGIDDQLDDTILSYLLGGEIPSFEQGGKVPMYLGGGTNFDTTSPTIYINGQFVPNPNYIDPTLSPQRLTTPVSNGTINNLGSNYLEGVNHTGVQNNNNPYLQDIGFKTPTYVQPTIGQGFTEKDALAALRQSANPVEGKNTEEEENNEWKDFRESFLSTLNSDTSMSIEDGLYKAGEALAFNPNDDIYRNDEGEVNKTAKGIGQGFNILKGVAAGGKVLLGGARNMMEGFAYQKKNDIIENERKRREILARKNANTRNAEDGGEIPFFNDGGYLQFLENGDTVSPFTQDEDVRPSEQAPREIELKGVQYYVYGEGNNTRMVPKSVVDNNPNSVYRTGEWNNQQFSSATQQGIRQEAVKRYESAPTNIKNLPKDEIIRMQQVLIDSGYDIGKTGADGIVGARTKRALEQMRANDLGAYKTWINTEFDPVTSSTPSSRVQAPTKAQVPKAQAPQAQAPQAQAPTRAQAPQAQVPTRAQVPQAQVPTRAQVPKGNVNIKDGQYYRDTNKITYKGKAYTPYQFLSLVKNMESNPMTNTFGAPEEMITLLNTALAANNKGLVKGKSVGYGNWKNQRPQFTTEEARKKYMGYEEGGEIPFFNDGGYLQFLENGGDDQYSQMGPQDPREQMPLPQEMTGEYIQQQPQEAGIIPNAEIETDEYVQHPNGEVQQAEGREHTEGGERVSLDPGTRIISDNLKLGAKNAKTISQEYGIKVKASDTFATAISKYTKKIGLEELNSQQEEYFNKLKKDSKTRSEETSELNSQYLSEKINGIEQKKSLLETLRSSFTNHIYELQEGSKPSGNSDNSKKKDLPTPEDIAQAMEMANNQQTMENGGLIRSFDNGGEFMRLAQHLGVEITPEKIQHLIRAFSVEDNSADYAYGYIKELSPYKDKLPSDLNGFANSKLGKSFGNISNFTKDIQKLNQDPVKYFAQTVPQTDNRSRTNTSKTKPDAETTVGTRGTKGSNYVSLADNPIYSRTKNSQGFTESGSGITTSGKVNKDNEAQVFKYLYDNFPGARKFFTTEKDFADRDINPKLKDVKGLQTYYNNTLLPSLKKWGQDNISNASELNNYYDALDQFSFDGKGTRQIDGVFGDFTGDKNPLRWKFVTPAEKKQLNDLGVSQVSDLYDESGKLKDKFNFLSQESKDRLNKTREYNGIDMYIDEIPEAPKNEQEPIEEYEKPLEKKYTRPVLPDMSLEPPRPMDAHAKNQRRFVLNNAIELSPENQINEIYRQSDAAADQFTGLTDTQRAAALSNLSASTQQNAAQVISGVEAANVQNRNQVEQANNAIFNAEENARIADAQRYEELQMTAKAKTQQDYDDFMDKNREIRIKRFNYLTKDRQINDMAENFKTDANGNIMFDPATGLPLKLPGVASSGQTEQVVKETRNADGSVTREIVTRPIGTKTKTK